jgi:8-oxoguanine deaminase
VAAAVVCGAHRADRVMVGGRWVVEDGVIPGLDMAALVRRHSAATKLLHAG